KLMQSITEKLQFLAAVWNQLLRLEENLGILRHLRIHLLNQIKSTVIHLMRLLYYVQVPKVNRWQHYLELLMERIGKLQSLQVIQLSFLPPLSQEIKYVEVKLSISLHVQVQKLFMDHLVTFILQGMEAKKNNS